LGFEMPWTQPDFRLLFESAPGLFLVLAVDPPRFTILGASDRYLRATMRTRQELVGRGLFEAFPDNPEDANADGVANLGASLARVVERREPDAMPIQKYDIALPDGTFTERFWSPVNTPVLGGEGELRYIIHRVEDVTEFVRMRGGIEQRELTMELRERAKKLELETFQHTQEVERSNWQLRKLQQQTEKALKRTEEQLRQAQKLEAIGRLAGGVAHDFNNLLTVILSYCALTRADLPEEHPLLANLDEIEQAGRRAAELTHQLLAFSRRQVVELQVLDLGESLSGMEKMLKRILGEDVELTIRLQPGLGRIRADRGQIEQIVMNLVVNARDALPLGGKLTLQTADVHLDEAYAREHLGVTPGPHVMLAVSDNGVGMPPEIQSRIFEPFFTTKEHGKGTGLGLSIVFGVVKQCGGHIWLYSEVGHGTTFKLYFPRVDAAAESLAPNAHPAPVGAGGGETILLAEDQEQVRAVTASILRRAGYRVLDATGPLDALRVCDEHEGPIHLLLSDVIMPKMNGRELADRVRERHPGVKLLFMSGYTDDVILRHGVIDTMVSFIEKPLTPTRLLQKVRAVLDADKASLKSQ
jgi:signal transduction histidine kinase/CheY-like chemotaxis protein